MSQQERQKINVDGIVHSQARRFAAGNEWRGITYDDFAQVGNEEAVRKIPNIDKNRGSGAEYLTVNVNRRMRREIRDKGWGVSGIPRKVKDNFSAVRAAESSLAAVLGHWPTVDEIAKETHVDPQIVEEVRRLGSQSAGKPFALAEPTSGDDGEVVPHQVSIESVAGQRDAEDLETAVVTRQVLAEAIATLSPKQREAVMLRYYGGVGEMSQSEIAKNMGISQMHVSRLLSKSHAILREKLKAVGFDRDE